MNFEEDIHSRLNRLEQKVDFLLNNLGLTQQAEAGLRTTVNPMMDQVVALLRQNRKIDAIKVYREQTGLGLKEAKDVIDNMRY